MLTSNDYHSYMYANDIVICSHDKSLNVAISIINDTLLVLSKALQSNFVTAPDKSQFMLFSL